MPVRRTETTAFDTILQRNREELQLGKDSPITDALAPLEADD
jgi:hypothetical protein